MAILINGNGNPAIYAAQDADLIASLAGNTTGIAKVGNEFAYTAQDANTINVADGVIVTKEGRRIQLDAGENDTFTIPAGTAGVTNYYIIGYHLHENASGQQVADTFAQLMANATETIQEDTFRGGASDVYVSLYRVKQDGVNLGTITLLLPKLTNISQINTALSDIGTHNETTTLTSATANVSTDIATLNITKDGTYMLLAQNDITTDALGTVQYSINRTRGGGTTNLVRSYDDISSNVDTSISLHKVVSGLKAGDVLKLNIFSGANVTIGSGQSSNFMEYVYLND